MNDPALPARTLAVLLGEWRGSGIAYRALADRIRLLILDGRVPSGTRLPAERELAERLHLSRATISAAYRDLRERGVLESVRGSGSVARINPARLAREPGGRPVLLDLARASLPAAPQLPEAALAAARALPRYLDADSDPVGLPELRAAIAARYVAAGLPTKPDQIMVTVGAQHAIGMVTRLLLARGDRALIEHPSYPYAHDTMRSLGARVVAVPVTAEEGWDTAEFVRTLERTSPALAYLMPDFHNPTGASMSRETRQAVCAASARQGTVLLIDETTAELNIDRPEPPRPFAVDNLSGAEIITVGTVGKTVWGGIRLGWVRAEAGTIRRLVAARSRSDLGTSILEQLTVLELFRDYDAIIALRGRQLGDTRDAVESFLPEWLPEWSVPHVHGGLAIWVGLGRPESSRLTLAARRHGLLLSAGPRFGADGAFERFLRIPITSPREVTETALRALAASWRDLEEGAS
ncbi:MocR-like transcription factor YczR [Mycetocola spongiae]|uniref:MocR-like transcription factor YczR n=1 Tax=Mycetocola spongiae TaxID=2859226 RepID=UPI001CF4D2F5|nr:PLP-dependent aminotransferase family protein [Mycetocola spongiae]UCR88467.1 PLP-dependent aminotransferase family protein [Mycetocola spongiae]